MFFCADIVSTFNYIYIQNENKKKYIICVCNHVDLFANNSEMFRNV